MTRRRPRTARRLWPGCPAIAPMRCCSMSECRMKGIDVPRRIRARDDAPRVAVLTTYRGDEARHGRPSRETDQPRRLARAAGAFARTDLAAPAAEPASAREDELIGMSVAMREVQQVFCRWRCDRVAASQDRDRKGSHCACYSSASAPPKRPLRCGELHRNPIGTPRLPVPARRSCQLRS